MRVVMVILEYLPITGGAQRQLASLAPLLQRAGAEVHVITRRAPGLVTEETLGDVRVHRLPAPGPKAIASLVFTLASLWRLRALRPDVVHAYSLFSPATIGVLARALLGVPVVVKVLRGGHAGDVERLRRKPLARLRIAAMRRAIRAFISISREIDAELEALGVDEARQVAIPNGVDAERFRPAAAGEREALRDELGLPAGPVAIYTGRLVPEKRVVELAASWSELRERVPGATLLVVGDGVCAAELRERAVDGVRLLGELDDVAPLLRAADVFVLPSATEGLSNALLEAMATGLPVVATRVGGAVDVVEDHRSGRLVSVDDTAALTAALAELLDPSQGAERDVLGRGARERMLTGYSLESVAARLSELYAEAVRGPADRLAAHTIVAGGGGEGARR